MNKTEIIGYFSAFLTTASFLPQAIKTITTKNTKGISTLMYVAFTFGIIGWICYGALIGDKIIVIANSITLVFSAAILAVKLANVWYKKD